ncbi:transport and Golgi organization protein 1 homolog isoform X5 [Felis catus]|uniref:transport and Golgi organization protein 1 homolog isoform X5 n=1 Tax=Felis catus TaxID=9685 RepID=UPI001D1A2CA6|nr:transport and Golgi organization protein 1 homolog isoform X5 [Felis catus]
MSDLPLESCPCCTASSISRSMNQRNVFKKLREIKFLSDEALKLKEDIKTVEYFNEILSDSLQSARVTLQSEREKNVKNKDLSQEWKW